MYTYISDKFPLITSSCSRVNFNERVPYNCLYADAVDSVCTMFHFSLASSMRLFIKFILVLYDSSSSLFFFIDTLSGDAETNFKRIEEALNK